MTTGRGKTTIASSLYQEKRGLVGSGRFPWRAIPQNVTRQGKGIPAPAAKLYVSEITSNLAQKCTLDFIDTVPCLR